MIAVLESCLAFCWWDQITLRCCNATTQCLKVLPSNAEWWLDIYDVKIIYWTSNWTILTYLIKVYLVSLGCISFLWISQGKFNLADYIHIVDTMLSTPVLYQRLSVEECHLLCWLYSSKLLLHTFLAWKWIFWWFLNCQLPPWMLPCQLPHQPPYNGPLSIVIYF